MGSTYLGDWEVNFHNVSNDNLNQKKFHTDNISEVNFFAPTNDTYTAALDFTAYGRLGNENGYKLIFRAGDYHAPGQFTDTSFDTVRIELYRDSELVYDTNGGDFTPQSTCVGTARTGLNNGNITIAN